MKTLKELVAMQTFTGKSDLDIIQDWFVENEMESEGIDLMNRLAKIKIDKQSFELGKLKGSLSMYGGTDVLYKEFGNKIGGKLDKISGIAVAASMLVSGTDISIAFIYCVAGLIVGFFSTFSNNLNRDLPFHNN